MKVKVSLMPERPHAKLPEYKTAGAAAFDISAAEKGAIFPGGKFVFPTGLKFEIPEGHVMLVFSRSGHAFNNDLRLANCVGVIDSDYRGELFVKLTSDLHNWRFASVEINAGDRITQGMIVPIPRVEFEVVQELSQTERGEGGLGSTGSN